jgi:hypothetical protein
MLNGMSQQVAVPPSRTPAVATRDGIVVPRVIAGAGDQAARRFLEFFAATIRNKNTRMAYYREVCDLNCTGAHTGIVRLYERKPHNVV